MKVLKVFGLLYLIGAGVIVAFHVFKPKKYYTIPIRRRDDGENS